MHNWIQNSLLIPLMLMATVASPALAFAEQHDKKLVPIRRLDQYGDPLPKHALHRLGTIRLRHGHAVSQLAFSADGKSLISFGHNEIHGWNVTTGEELFYRKFSSGAGRPLAVSPGGKWLVSKTKNGLTLLDVTTGATVRKLGKTGLKESPVSDAWFFLTAKILVTADKGKELTLWNTTKGSKGQLQYKFEKLREIQQIAVSAGGDLIAGLDGSTLSGTVTTGTLRMFGPGHRITIWNGNGKKLRQWRLDNKKGRVSEFALSPDGKMLAFAFPASDKVAFWNSVTGRLMRELPIDGVARLAFSSDGKMLAADDVKGGVSVWDAYSGKRVHALGTHVPLFDKSSVFALAFSPNGKLLASGGNDNAIRIWELPAGKERFCAVGHKGATPIFNVMPDGRRIVSRNFFTSAQRHFAFCLWNASTGKLERKVTLPSEKVAQVIAGGVNLAITMKKTKGTLELYDLDSGKRHRFNHPEHKLFEMYWEPQLSSNGRWLATVTQPPKPKRRGFGFGGKFKHPHQELQELLTLRDASIHIWQIGDGKKILQFSCKNLSGCTLSPNGKTLCTLSREKFSEGPYELIFWDVQTRRKRCSFKHDGLFSYSSLGFARNGVCFRVVLRQNERRQPVLLDVQTGRILSCVDFSDRDYRYSDFDPSGRLFVSSECFLCETDTGQVICKWNLNEESFYYSRAFSHDGRTIAIGTPTGSIFLYDAPTGRQIDTLTGHRGRVDSLQFSHDSKRLVSASTDTTMLIWDVEPFRKKPQAKPVRKTKEQLDKLWKQLANKDAKNAWHVVGELVAASNSSVQFLSNHLRPATKPAPAAINKMIANLGNKRFSVRERSEAKLEQLGFLAEPALRGALKKGASLEVHMRIELLLNRIKYPRPTSSRLQQMRALHALEWTSTDDARKLLKNLAAGNPDAWLTREARWSLERMGQTHLP